MPSLILSLSNPLPEVLYLYGKRINTIELLRAIEKDNNLRILTRDNKVTRHLVNVTLEINIEEPSRAGEPLRIPSKNGNHTEIYPKF